MWGKCRTSFKTFVNNFEKKKQVRNSILARFVALIMQFLQLWRNQSQYIDLYTEFKWTLQLCEENVELHLKCLLTILKKKTSKELYISPLCCPDNALFAIVEKSKPIYWFVYGNLMKSPIGWRKCWTSLKTFVNNFLKNTS